MALAANVQRSCRTRAPKLFGLPVLAEAVIYDGALVCIDASGYAIAATTTDGLAVAGVAQRGFDNTGGANGVLGAAPARYCEVDEGEYSFACAGSPIAGAVVYVVDDNNVTTVAGNVVAGVLTEPDPLASGNWYVDISKAHVGLAVLGT